VDITAPANAIEYHPALLAHAEEGGTGGGTSAANGPGLMHINPSHIPSSTTFPVSRRYPVLSSDSGSDSDLSDISDGDLSEGFFDSDFEELENIGALSPAEQSENESFGIEYNGPKLADEETSRLLVLMSHASTCPGRYVSCCLSTGSFSCICIYTLVGFLFYSHIHAKHRDVCSSVKYMMLHVRDCPGTTATFDICPFPWCRKVKHSLYHLVSCVRPTDCSICSPEELSPNLTALIGLNEYRRKKQRERRAAAMAAAAAAAKAKPTSRAAPRSKAGAVPKTAYRPPVSKPGVTQPAAATALKKGALMAAQSPHRPVIVPPKTVVATSTTSAVATAAAAAAAAARVAATAAVSTAKVPPPQTKPTPKPGPAGVTAKPPTVAKPTTTPTMQWSKAATSGAPPILPPPAAAASIPKGTGGASLPASKSAAASVATAAQQKPSPSAAVTHKPSPSAGIAPTPAKPVIPTSQTATLTAAEAAAAAAALTVKGVVAQKDALIVAAEAAKLQAATSLAVTKASTEPAAASNAIKTSAQSGDPAVGATKSVQPTVAATSSAVAVEKQPEVAVETKVKAAVKSAALTSGKPSSGVQPRIVTVESAAKEAPVAAAVAKKVTTAPHVLSNATAEPISAETNPIVKIADRVGTQVKTEQVSPEKAAGFENKPVADDAAVKCSDSPSQESPPPTAAVPAAPSPIVKAENEPRSEIAALARKTTNCTVEQKEHCSDEEHNEENCPDECCAESRAAAAGDVKENANAVVMDPSEQTTPEEKTNSLSRSPDSADLSSSCSDEVKKNEDVVRISSC